MSAVLDESARPDDAPTIYAPATGPGVAAVAVIRLSGPMAGTALAALAGRLPAPRQASVRRLVDPETHETLDTALLLWFPAPSSYTGEDVAELHLHGGFAVQQGVLDALARLPGLRLAEPGEFTRRAFENGKLDLTAAEGVADLVAAETAGQRRQALAQLAGGLGRLYEGWRAELVGLLAHLEADIDFPDEDLPEGVAAAVRPELARLRDAVAAHIADRRGERVRDGFRIAILGAPNAGKSSILNRLARRDAAIVATRAGTTRDIVEVRMDLAGFAVMLSDTAGLRVSDDEIEREGMRRAHVAAEQADLRLVVVDAAAGGGIDPAVAPLIGDNALIVANKVDLAPDGAARLAADLGTDIAVIGVSAQTGEGVAALEERIRAAVVRALGGAETPSLSRARHREALIDCRDALGRALDVPDVALAAEDVRLAVRALGRITGRVDIDEILDVIFRDFCIGK